MTIGNKIAYYRKNQNITQDALAQQLGVTNQAVSKWESDQCCPDVLLLPRLADIFGVSVDGIFDRAPKQQSAAPDPQWPDDNILRVLMYVGNRLVGSGPVKEGYLYKYEETVDGVISGVGISCGDVAGDVSAGGSVTCGDIGGDVSAGAGVHCGDIGGDVSAGAGVYCGDIGGDLNAGSNAQCGNIGGDVSAGADVQGGDVGGDVNAGLNVTCGDVSGDVDAGCTVECGNVEGDIDANGPVTIRK